MAFIAKQILPAEKWPVDSRKVQYIKEQVTSETGQSPREQAEGYPRNVSLLNSIESYHDEN